MSWNLLKLILVDGNYVKDRSLNNKLDANNPHNIAVVGQTYNKKNEYSKFNILNNNLQNLLVFELINGLAQTASYFFYVKYFLERNQNISYKS